MLEIARSSHERIDGTGYPDGKKGDEIPLAARIVFVADAFDALTTDRPYRRGRHVAGAVEEIRLNAGTQFCATVVSALDRVYREEPHLLGADLLRAVGGATALPRDGARFTTRSGVRPRLLPRQTRAPARLSPYAPVLGFVTSTAPSCWRMPR